MLFDDIGPSLILLPTPDLQLRFLVQFLAFLGLPTDSVFSAAPCSPDVLLESLSILTQGKTNSSLVLYNIKVNLNSYSVC